MCTTVKLGYNDRPILFIMKIICQYQSCAHASSKSLKKIAMLVFLEHEKSILFNEFIINFGLKIP